MADDTTSKFKKMLSFFEGIRDERNTAANTASRIGRAFIMLLDYCANGVAGLYLSKTKDDETTHKLTMGEATVGGDATIRGKVVTDDIHSSDSDGNTSMTGKGWTLKNVRDETGSYSVLAVDNIVVRKKLEAAELEIHRKTYVGAQMIASDWGHKILRVDPVTYDPETGDVSSVSGLTLFTLPVTVDGAERPVAFVGRAISDTETRVELLGDGKGMLNRELETTANAFKVYFCESDGTASIEDDLVVGSMGQCQEFNVKARVTHNFQNTYYWGVCVMHGVEDNVLIGGKPTKCVYGVFAHTTKLLTLTSEVSKHTFTCYGMEQSGCTFPVAGDDMVGFGCADPWQDADRCNAIIIASKDGEQSAPSVISYSGIGRKRTGDIAGTLDADGVYQAYAGIEEQYSVPSAKDDSRLDFRVSKKAGNVFKGDLYFKGSDGTMQPIGATYMLSADKSVVDNGGSLTVSVYKVVAGKAEPMKADDVTKAGLQLFLTRSEGTTADVTSYYPTISWSTLSNNHSDVKNVVINLLKDNNILDTVSVALGEKAVAQTEVWRLIPIMEKASIDYDIDKTQYSNYAESGETGDDTIDKVFVKKGNISLQYKILHRKSDLMQTYSSMSGMPDGYYLTVTEHSDSDAIASYSSKDKNDGATNLRNSLMFSDSSSRAANVSYITVMLYDNNNDVIDRREVRTNLGTNGVFDMNKKFLAYIYYGTDGTKGTQYINQRVTDMKSTVETLTSRIATAEDGIKENKTNITKTAEGIKTTVKSLYTEGNLLWGANVMGMFRKMFRVYTSETIRVKAGITYTLTVKAWMRANTNNSQKPFYTDHAMRISLHGTKLMDNYNGNVVAVALDRDWVTTPDLDSYCINRIVFTATEDTDLYVTINEIVENSSSPDPGVYGGVYVDWLRIDAGEHDTEEKNQFDEWAPAAKDIETINLLPDPEFENGISYSDAMGERNSWNWSDKKMGSAVKWMSKDNTSEDGACGVLFNRSGANSKTDDGLRYIVPFRGPGTYSISCFVKDLHKTDSTKPSWDDGTGLFMECHPMNADKERITGGFSTSGFPLDDRFGDERHESSHTFGTTATHDNGDSTTTEMNIAYLEVRIFLQKNGCVRVSRMCLSKSEDYTYWNANALSTELGRTLSMESYAYQRAYSMGAGIRQGLQSVGFRMDSATWSVKTWGSQFAWYATEADANGTDLSKAVMYMAKDNSTWTLHVKGYVEATGGTFNGTVKADLLYGKTMDVTETTNYDIDPSTSPATCFLYRDPGVGVHYITLPKASDYDGLEIQVFFLCTKPLTRVGFPYVYIRAKSGETLYAKESVKAGTKDSNGHTPYIMDLNTEYTAYNEKGNNTWCFLARNNLNRFKSMGGNWYAIDGYFGNIY